MSLGLRWHIDGGGRGQNPAFTLEVSVLEEFLMINQEKLPSLN